MKIKKWLAALFPLVVAASSTELARAQEVVAAPPPPDGTQTRSETVTEKGGPSQAMLASGVLTLGLTYGAGVTVAATSSLPADHRMFVPIAGPWMALADRGPCGGPGQNSCDQSTTYTVLIVADGLGQALGALTIVEAFLNPETRTVSRSTTADGAPRIRLAPTAMGAGGYGMLAMGAF